MTKFGQRNLYFAHAVAVAIVTASISMAQGPAGNHAPLPSPSQNPEVATVPSTVNPQFIPTTGPVDLPPLLANAVNPNPPHLVLEAPKPQRKSHLNHGHRGHGHATHGHAVQGQHEPQTIYVEGSGSLPAEHAGGPQAKPEYPLQRHAEAVKTKFLHGDKTARAVPIPNANRVPVWKTPYSYGHFGASRNRQWTLHNGHQETYTQWTLR